MSNVKLEWQQATYAESFNIYRSASPMSIGSMPAPIAADVAQNYYFDMSIVVDETYFYRVGAIRGENELISDEVEVFAGAPIVNDPHWSKVNLLVFADAISFPSTSFIDSSSFARALSKTGSPQIVAPSVVVPKYDFGSIFLAGNAGDRVVSSAIAALDADVTAECFINFPADATNMSYARIIDLNGVFVMQDATNSNKWTIRFGGGAQPVSVPLPIITGIWHHVVLQRIGVAWYLFFDGVLMQTATPTTPISLSSAVGIGGGGTASRSLRAYINSFRYTVGIARYPIEGFTPPTEKFPNS